MLTKTTRLVSLKVGRKRERSWRGEEMVREGASWWERGTKNNLGTFPCTYLMPKRLCVFLALSWILFTN